MFVNENGIDKELTGKDAEAVLQAQSEISAEIQKKDDLIKETKNARIAILTRLGLTEDDFKALGL